MSEASMTFSLAPAAGTSAARTPLAVWLMRLLAVNSVALYAGAVSMLHGLHEVPIHQTWMIGVLGFMLLFLAIGVVASGRPLGFFSDAQQRFSLDWLPILLIWPIGLSIWSCLALGLASIQTKQQLGNGITLPLMLLAATVPPLLLGRLQAWIQPAKPWQRLCDLQYVLTTLASAIILFVAVYQALLHDLTVIAPTAVEPMTPASAVTAHHGFVCNPNAPSPYLDEEEAGENSCPSSPSAGTAKPTAIPGANVVRPIDQHFSLWGAALLLAGGCALIVGRKIDARGKQDGTNGLANMPINTAELVQMAEAAEKGVLGQIAPWLHSSGVPGADVLAEAVAKLAEPNMPGVTPVSPVPIEISANPVTAVVTVLPAEPLSVVQPAPTDNKAPLVTETALVPASVSSVVSAPTTEEENPLSDKVTGIQDTLHKQEQVAGQLQNNVSEIQDKLEKQAQTLSQALENAQHDQEESRRTIDSLTRLVQSMKADLDRLSKNQSGTSQS